MPVGYNEDQFKNVYTNGEVPAFDDLLKDNDDAIISTNDYTDFIEKDKRKRVLKIVGIAVGATLVVSGLGLGVYSLLKEPAPVDKTPIVTVTEPGESPTDTDVKAEKDDKGKKKEIVVPIDPDTPLLSLIPGAPPVNSKQAELKPGKASFTASTVYVVSFKKGKVTAADEKCLVTKGTDFCYAGTVKIDKDVEAAVYFLKDAARSGFFENPEEFTQVPMDWVAAAATMNVAVRGTTQEVLAIVFHNMSGLMLIPTEGNMDKLVESITIK